MTACVYCVNVYNLYILSLVFHFSLQSVVTLIYLNNTETIDHN